jgi:hypothetical protein
MTFEQFIVAAQAYKIKNPPQRLGQAYMNYLWQARPDLYEEVVTMDADGWMCDPFYDDSNINRFFKFVAKAW